jgi:hypothetical protein
MKMEMWHCILFAVNRQERREEILDMLEDKGFKIENIVDYTLQKKMVFLEGTEAYPDRANEKSILCFVSSS